MNVDNGSGDEHENATAVSGAAGGVAVVWDDGDYGYPVTARAFAPAGTPLGGPLAIETSTTVDALRPLVAVDGSGGFVVVWGEDVYPSTLRGRRFDAAGAPVGTPFTVTTDALVGHYPGFLGSGSPALAAGPAGDFVVAWASDSTDAIYARRFDATDAPLGASFPVNAGGAFDFQQPDVAVDADGKFVVVWQEEQPFPERESVMARYYDAGGTPAGPPFVVGGYTTGGQYAPTVAMDEHGWFVVAWTGYGGTPNGYAGTFARRFAVPEVAGVTGGDPAALEGTFELRYTDEPSAVRGSFVLPPAWRVAKDKVLKYVNSSAPHGPGAVKVGLVRPAGAATVVAKRLGDGSVLDWRPLAGGLGWRLKAKGGVPAACP